MSQKNEELEQIPLSIAEIAAEAELMAQHEVEVYENELPDELMPIAQEKEEVKTKKEPARKVETPKVERKPEPIDEAGEDTEISLKKIIGGDILGSDWFRRQFFYIFLLGVLAILYVTNRYSYQHELIEQRVLVNRLEDRKKRALVANCELVSFMRTVNIKEYLPDTTIKVTTDPYYYINLNEQ